MNKIGNITSMKYPLKEYNNMNPIEKRYKRRKLQQKLLKLQLLNNINQNRILSEFNYFYDPILDYNNIYPIKNEKDVLEDEWNHEEIDLIIREEMEIHREKYNIDLGKKDLKTINHIKEIILQPELIETTETTITTVIIETTELIETTEAIEYNHNLHENCLLKRQIVVDQDIIHVKNNEFLNKKEDTPTLFLENIIDTQIENIITYTNNNSIDLPNNNLLQRNFNLDEIIIPNELHTGNNILQTGNNIEHKGNNILNTGNNIEQTGNNKEQTGNNIEHNGNNILHTGNNILHTGNNIEHTGNNNEQIGNNNEHTGNNILHTGNNIEHNGNNNEQIGNNILHTGNNILHTGNNILHTGNNIEADVLTICNPVVPEVLITDYNFRSDVLPNLDNVLPKVATKMTPKLKINFTKINKIIEEDNQYNSLDDKMKEIAINQFIDYLFDT
jgi:hypothetical protein